MTPSPDLVAVHAPLVAARALFAADVVALSGRVHHWQPPHAEELVGELRRAGARLFDRPEEAARVASKATPRLLDHHQQLVARVAARVSRTWLALADRTGADVGACPSCGRQTSDETYAGRLYPSYVRRIGVCPEHGIIADQPEWTPRPRVRVDVLREPGAATFRIAPTFAAERPRGLVAAAFERQGLPGAAGPPVRLSQERTVVAPVRVDAVLPPALYWVTLLHADQLDVALYRIAVYLPS